MYKNIYDYIVAEEHNYQQPIHVEENWDWSMKEHINLTTLYKNSQLKTGKNDDKPVKNIIRPILNLQYRAEGFDVKDIQIYVDNFEQYYKSFLVKKFHEKWARDHDLDTFIDDMVESYVDFGGTLVKKTNEVAPEVVPWQSIAFCDQTDILSGPIAIRHYYSPDQLLEMSKVGWGEESNGATMSLDKLISIATEAKTPDKQDGIQVKTPGKYIEVYEVHGNMPETYLDGKDPLKFVTQIQIVSFYKDSNNDKQWVTLFKGKEKELPFKLVLRDKIYGRGLGLGGAEELFEAQVWTTYGLIKQKGMLDAASKTLYKTTDATFATRNKTNNLENGEIMVLKDGKDINQINTAAVNVPMFERFMGEWEAHAQQMGSANDALMGRSPTAGTPFKLQELVTEEGRSLHEYRKGKLATFLDEIYRDWIIPQLSKEVAQGSTFLAELSLEELQTVADRMSQNVANNFIKEKILNGELINDEEVEALKTTTREQFMSTGNQKFIKILEGEMKKAPLSVKVSIAGKQKNLSSMTDKLVNVFRQLLTAPQVLQDPTMAKLFNQILEASGMNPLDFTNVKPVSQPATPQLEAEKLAPALA